MSKAGQHYEANNHALQDKRMVKSINEAVINEGYAWKQGSDHEFYQFRPALIKDPDHKEMWGAFTNGENYTGRVREQGIIGETQAERVQQHMRSGWQDLKEDTRNAWEQFKGYFRRKDKE